jgi:nucleotide-binding universal stress UspA family protein
MTTQTTKIVVPLDGSPLAEQVLRHLPQLASPAQTEIILVHVSEAWRYATTASEFAMPVGIYPYVQASMEAYIEGQRTKLQEQGYQVSPQIRLGLAAEGILEAADATQADYIAMTTHGRSGFARWAIGSVAERVLQNSTIPILLTRGDQAAPTSLVQQILVPLDGSALAERALPEAQRLASINNAQILLVRVLQALDEESKRILFASPAIANDALERERSAAEQYLQGIATRLQASGVVAECEVRFGDPVPTILQVADEKQVSLIVMTTHGHTAIKQWFYGSVANKILRGAQCPILMVRNLNTPKGHTDDEIATPVTQVLNPLLGQA